MRPIVKKREPATLTETRAAPTTDLSATGRARTAFDQIDKQRARERLADEQGWLCAFCMQRIDPGKVDARGEPVVKIAHRTPIDVDPSKALSWTNLLGSCDGGQRSGWRTKSCDAAQGSTALTVDPTLAGSCALLSYELRTKPEKGLYITSTNAELRRDVEETLGLNSGDLPALRLLAWNRFIKDLQARHPKAYGKQARRDFLATWARPETGRLPVMLGVIEAKVR